MIDLSNNNGAVDFRRLHANGFRRVYLKRTEGTGFVDGKHDAYRKSALAAGLKVGEYHFAHPEQNSPQAEASFFVQHLPKLRPGQALRPCLDLEVGRPSLFVGSWAERFVQHVHDLTGCRVVIYSTAYYLEACKFSKPPGPLWVAGYGIDDGKEHPYTVPKPWKVAAAHQYTDQARVIGVEGHCDVSHVLHPWQLDVHRWPVR